MSGTKKEKLYTLQEACEYLSISSATGRNWIKSGRLIPSDTINKKPVFSKKTIAALKQHLTTGTLSGLKKRRNKTCITGMQTYHSYISKDSENHSVLTSLLELLEEKSVSVTETFLRCLLRNCAEQLLFSVGTLSPTLQKHLLNDLVCEQDYVLFQKNNPEICSLSYTYLPKEDTLGFLYLSLSGLKERKNTGSYYTPAHLAQQFVKQHLPNAGDAKNILDPSCGTGIFLLQLPDTIPLSRIYGSDLNPVCIFLTRINLALKHCISTDVEISILQQNITVSDFLKPVTASTITYDLILGNPPWGAKLSSVEKATCRDRFSCTHGNMVETYDLFLEQSLNCLSEHGILSFIVPEAVLNVKAHKPVRELLLAKTSVLSVEYLGEVFEQVHCPSIILTLRLENGVPFFKNVTVCTTERTFSTKVEHIFNADFFAFSQTDEEYLLLQKLANHPNSTTLVEQAVFALGIVTGDNNTLLHSNRIPGSEPVIKGSDISKYHIHSHSGYLKFQPEIFQQTAPEPVYRAPEKLFYRFINKQLIFAYDNTGLLSLNSCNILIPQIPGLSIKYVLAILNSGVAQFIFEKSFRSVKVLRSHIERIPIPLANEQTQKEIVLLVDKLINLKETSIEYQETFSFLDKKIADLFQLTKQEYELIKYGSV